MSFLRFLQVNTELWEVDLRFKKNKETKKKTDLYLKLSVECPIKRGFYLDENIVCGMDIGKVIPIMAFMGVRMSWDILDRKELLAWLAVLAA